jgi:hypothetical protein
VAKRKVHQSNPAIRNREWAQLYFDAAKYPAAWLSVARRLRSSAEAIFDREKPTATRTLEELLRLGAEGRLKDFDTKEYPAPNLDAAYMLMAFAIENLLKGLMVGKGSIDFSNHDKLPEELLTHNLCDLHNLAEPTATIAPYLLDALTYMAEWRRVILPQCGLTSCGQWMQTGR